MLQLQRYVHTATKTNVVSSPQKIDQIVTSNPDGLILQICMSKRLQAGSKESAGEKADSNLWLLTGLALGIPAGRLQTTGGKIAGMALMTVRMNCLAQTPTLVQTFTRQFAKELSPLSLRLPSCRLISMA